MNLLFVPVSPARWVLLSAALILLAGCARFGAAPALPEVAAPVAGGALLDDAPAFGQRIAIDATGAALLEARFRRGPGTPWEPLDRFVQLPDRLLFELPAPGPLPALTDPYEDRGPVEVGFFPAGAPPAADPLRSVSYQPYGSVVAGEINVVTRFTNGNLRACARRTLRLINRALESGRARLPEDLRRSVAVSGSLGLCFVTVEIGANDTEAVLAQIEALPQVLAAGRNVVLDLDGGTVNAFDPTCDQTGDDGPVAVGSEGFTPLFPPALRAAVAAGVAEANGVTGASATVAIVGGGVAPQVLSLPGQIVGSRNLIDPGQPPLERFGCDFDEDGTPDSLGHDTHIAELVSLIAPDASLRIAKICSDDGLCPSGKLAMALLQLAEGASGPVIVNASAGSPLPDPAVEAILEADGDAAAPRLLLVSTAGNLPLAIRHSPGDLDLAAGGSLGNVIAVGASGRTEPLVWAEAPFSNDLASLLAPGVRLCPATATGFTCSGPDDAGIGGTSYAAGVVSGLLALYADMKTQAGVSFAPTQLRPCLLNQTPDGTRPQFVYDAAGGC